MRRPALLLLATVACVVGSPASSPAAPSSGAGWSSVGPPPRVGATSELAAAGDTVVVLAGPDRVVISHACETRTSADRGRRWVSALLPGCHAVPGVFDAPRLAFADDRHGVAVQTTQAWSTTDGGHSWRLAPEPAAGDAVGVAAVSPTVFVRVVASPPSRVPLGSSSAPAWAVQR